MEYGGSDTSGTDDDLPPLQNRVPRGSHVAANGRSSLGSAPYSRMHIDMEAQIHQLEQEAYCSVLRAFKAQSDAISWEKEGLITELRKELRVSDDEHRELLTKVNADDIIRRIRDWRLAGGNQPARHNPSQPVHDVLPSPSLSASRKKQKTSQLGQILPGLAPANSMQYPSSASAGNRQFIHRSSSGALPGIESSEADPWIGKRVWTRWPEDNSFYEAVITDYNPVEGRHALIYDQNMPNETWEWVDLKEIPPDDIRWEGGDPGIVYRGGHGRQDRVFNKPFSQDGRISGGGRGRGSTKGQFRKDYTLSQNGVAKKVPDDIELLNTESLVQEVERVFDASNPDLLDLEKAKKMLKEHEQALLDAIARLPDASDGESDGEQPFSH